MKYTCEGKSKKEEKTFGKTKYDQHFKNNSLERLQKEFSKCKETMSENLKNDMNTRNDNKNNFQKNKFSNNLHVNNKKIDDFINLTSEPNLSSHAEIGGRNKFIGNKKNSPETLNEKQMSFKSNRPNQQNGKEKESKPNASKNSFYLKDLDGIESKMIAEISDDEGRKDYDNNLEEKISYVNKIKNKFDRIPFNKKKEKKNHKSQNDNELEEELLKSALEMSKYDV